MANRTYKSMSLKIDDAGGSLTDISPYCNQGTLQRTINLLDDSSIQDDDRSILVGLAGTTVSINGFINSTTEAIFGPLVNNATSVTKTIQYGIDASRAYRGECLPSNVRISGSVDSLQTFSCDLTFDGAVLRTSVLL